jgi:hypothetical protein
MISDQRKGRLWGNCRHFGCASAAERRFQIFIIRRQSLNFGTTLRQATPRATSRDR